MNSADFDDINLETDLSLVEAALDREPPSASFALAANLFHAHAAKDRSSRRGIKSLIKPENAAAVLGHLPTGPEHRTHAVLRGDFVLCDLIPAIIGERGHVDRLHIATLGMSSGNADTLLGLGIAEITILCSHYFAKVDKDTVYREVSAKLAGRARLIVARNHAKIICLPTRSGDHFVIEGSANLRSSDNIEQITILNDPDLLAFHVSWIDQLASHA
jgi:hypothetical protein